MDYNNPEFNAGENSEQTVTQEQPGSETAAYVEYSQVPPNGTPDMNYYVQPEKKSTDVLAIISLVMGILSLLCCCMGFGIIFGIAGIVLAGISIANRGAKGIAVGGLVTSIIGAVFSVIVIIYVVFSYVTFTKNPSIYKDILEEIQDGTYDGGSTYEYNFDDDWTNDLY